MARGLLNKLVSRSLSLAGKWQQQQLRRLNIHKDQGAELMGKFGVNVPKGVAVSSVQDVRKAIQDVFPSESEGLETFKNGFKGGVHIVKVDQVEEIAGKMLGQILVTKQTRPQGKVVSKGLPGIWKLIVQHRIILFINDYDCICGKWCCGLLGWEAHWDREKLKEFIDFTLHYIADLDIPIKRFMPIGRNYSQEEWDEFEKYDKVLNIRPMMVSVLREKFAHLKLTFSIGGQITFDVCPQGWDKTYCLRYVDDFREIHFFGDKTYKGGNDHEIYESERTMGHIVTSPEDTVKQCTALFLSKQSLIGIVGHGCVSKIRWASSSSEASLKPNKKITDRLFGVIDAVNDYKLPLELCGQRNAVFKNGLLHQKATGGRLKIKHKKNKVKLAVLQFYKVDDSGKVQRLKNECPNVEYVRKSD
ncbi:unnamed protein product [Camellia sinensis]